MKIFVVILNWNQPKLTTETVESVKKLKYEKGTDLRIVVVDNGSTDNSVEQFRKLKGIQLLTSVKNLGFAEGNNLGIKHALDRDADFVLVLNNDTEVDKNLIIELLKPMKDEKVAVTSPKIYFAKGYEFHKEKYKKNELGKVLWYAGGKIDWKNIKGHIWKKESRKSPLELVETQL